MRKTLVSFVSTYFILLAVFSIALCVVSMIPSSLLRHNMESTASQMKNDGTYPSIGFPWRRITLDNFADSIALNIAYSTDSSTPLQSALVNVMYQGKTDGISPVENLDAFVQGRPVTAVEYERYWHGYLVYLRPLLTVMPYTSVRVLLSLGVIFGIVLLLTRTWRDISKRLATGLLIGFIFVDVLFVGSSIEFSGVFLVGIYGALYIISKRRTPSIFPLVFFVIGALASYVDLLSAPLVSLGIPLLVALHIEKKRMKTLIVYCTTWSIGYLLLWASKWVITDMLFNRGAIQTGLSEIMNRTVHTPDPMFTHALTLKINAFQLLGYDKRNKVVILCAALAVVFPLFKYVSLKQVRKERLLLWVCIGILPYLWYLIAANHSYLHVWFTYRNQFLSVVAVWLAGAELIDWKRVRADLHQVLPQKKS